MAASFENDSDDEETFIAVGTPLPFIDEDDPRKKVTSLQSQPVTDSKGKARFHGAFTGGFSAGYFNTVGSKEGWTPSAFVSSRSGKELDVPTQRPEDFMDDDDFGEHGIAPRQFKTAADFTSEERKRKREAIAASLTLDSVIGGTKELVDLIVPDILPIGIRLLRKMGWKEGQGIGPRKRKKKKLKSATVKLYGCALPPSGSDSELSDDELIKNFTFAPKDVAPLPFEPKDNKHGLGYSGLNPRVALPSAHVNLFGEPPPVRKGGKKGIRGQAFGVGALEDEDDDVYTVDHMSNYDMTMGEEKESLFGWTAPGHHKSASQTPISYIGKILEGFTLSNKMLEQKKVFPPPKLPPHYQPIHKFLDDTVQKETTKRQKLDAVSRGALLDETPIMNSVFDLVPKAYKEKIEVTKQNIDANKARLDAKERVSDSANKFTSPTEYQKNFHSQSKSTFKPFIRDPAKQERYEKYLELVKQGNKDSFQEVTDSQMTEWDRQREREEFERAATLYKPLAAALASRFTTGKTAESTDVVEEQGAEKDDQKKAVEMKMFGKLTREITEWHPDKCLCKRFNVPDPYPGSDIIGVPKVKKEKWSVFSFLNNPTQATTEDEVENTTQLALPPTDPDQEERAPLTNPLKFTVKSEKLKSTSIFSHLDDESIPSRQNKELQPKGGSNKLKRASIFSHLIDDEELKEPSKPNSSFKESEEQVSEDTPESKKTQDVTNKEDDGPVDLFRAIFRNTDSEDSSDSDSDEGNKDIDVENQKTDDLAQSLSSGTTNVEDKMLGEKDTMSTTPDFLPGGSVLIESIEQRLHQESDNESNDEMYGPALPPQRKSETRGEDYFQSLLDSRKIRLKKKHKHKSKHKRKKDKEKLRKQRKKEKKKEKRKAKNKSRHLRQESSDESSSDVDKISCGSDSDATLQESLPSDREILERLKSLSGNRPKAADFM